MVEHVLTERKHISKLMCNEPSHLNEEASLQRRIGTIEALVTYCRVREAPRQRPIPCRDWGIVDQEPDQELEQGPASAPDLFPMICTSTQCLFCLGNTGLSFESRTFCFSRPRKAREHVEQKHLRFFASGDQILCPHPKCQEVLHGIMHFKNHAATAHNCFLFARSSSE
jgi:hypothetical protein